MTSVAYIHGLPPTLKQMDAKERKQRGRNVPKQRPIDYLQMTDGQMRLALLAEQLRILESYTPENKSYSAARTLLENNLFQGLHTAPGMGYTTSNDPVVLKAVEEIRQAKRMTRPAAGQAMRSKQVRLGDPIVPILNCNQLHPILSIEQFTAQGAPASVYQSYVQDQNNKRQKCADENKWREFLNDKWEKQAHVPLYEFVSNTGGLPADVIPKRGGHRNFIDLIASQSKISRANISLWTRNGVMRYNALGNSKGNLGPIGPEESLEILISGGEQGFQFTTEPITGTVSIGDFGITTVIIIIAAIGAAYANAKTAASVLKGETSAFQGAKQVLTNTFEFVAKYGSLAFNPEAEDWNTGSGSTTTPPPPPPDEDGLSIDTNTLLFGGAAVLLLLSSRK